MGYVKVGGRLFVYIMKSKSPRIDPKELLALFFSSMRTFWKSVDDSVLTFCSLFVR